MPCSEETYKADAVAGENRGSHSAMCVPINVRFFDPTNTRPISQVVGGSSFVARVYAQPDNEVCSGTLIDITHSATAVPIPPGPIPDTSSPFGAISIPDPVIGMNPPSPLSQFTSAPNGLYTYTVISTNQVLIRLLY